MKDVHTIGIDIGSTASKCLILRDGKTIVGKATIPYGAGTSGPGRARAQALESAGLIEEDMAFSLATGYGRNSTDLANLEMSELTCHAKGAHFLFPETRTVIDIGGQDVKVLRLGENGALDTFAMNEKCAAGTGRFLEVMARVLEVDINDMAGLAAQSTVTVEISSTCTVFAESEVISQLAQNKDRRDIINGIHSSVARRVAGLARRVGVEPAVVMSGGVALNGGVIMALERELGTKISTSALAQYTGALGAALLAWQKYLQINKQA